MLRQPADLLLGRFSYFNNLTLWKIRGGIHPDSYRGWVDEVETFSMFGGTCLQGIYGKSNPENVEWKMKIFNG